MDNHFDGDPNRVDFVDAAFGSGLSDNYDQCNRKSKMAGRFDLNLSGSTPFRERAMQYWISVSGERDISYMYNLVANNSNNSVGLNQTGINRGYHIDNSGPNSAQSAQSLNTRNRARSRSSNTSKRTRAYKNESRVTPMRLEGPPPSAEGVAPNSTEPRSASKKVNTRANNDGSITPTRCEGPPGAESEGKASCPANNKNELTIPTWCEGRLGPESEGSNSTKRSSTSRKVSDCANNNNKLTIPTWCEGPPGPESAGSINDRANDSDKLTIPTWCEGPPSRKIACSNSTNRTSTSRKANCGANNRNTPTWCEGPPGPESGSNSTKRRTTTSKKSSGRANKNNNNDHDDRLFTSMSRKDSPGFECACVTKCRKLQENKEVEERYY